MNREELLEYIAQKRSNGYNCCQVTTTYFAQRMGVDEELLYKLSEGFGGGMGKMEGVCGGIVGAAMIAGLKNSRGLNAEVPPTISSTLGISKEILQKFRDRNGAIICKDLKSEQKQQKKTCVDCIADSIEIAEEVLDLH